MPTIRVVVEGVMVVEEEVHKEKGGGGAGAGGSVETPNLAAHTCLLACLSLSLTVPELKVDAFCSPSTRHCIPSSSLSALMIHVCMSLF